MSNKLLKYMIAGGVGAIITLFAVMVIISVGGYYSYNKEEVAQNTEETEQKNENNVEERIETNTKVKEYSDDSEDDEYSEEDDEENNKNSEPKVIVQKEIIVKEVEKKSEPKEESKKSVNVGETIKFGEYEQDNNISNGKEDIEWLVLAKDGNSALVVSKKGLDCKKYNEYNEEVTWEDCTLRRWLNYEFYNNAFSGNEQNRISTVTINNPDNIEHGTEGGNSTTDNLFLLSIDEANRYFKSDIDRVASATEYAKARGAYVAENGKTWSWLRSPGYDNTQVASVRSGGGVIGYAGLEVDADDGTVRPAMWVDIDE